MPPGRGGGKKRRGKERERRGKEKDEMSGFIGLHPGRLLQDASVEGEAGKKKKKRRERGY